MCFNHRLENNHLNQLSSVQLAEIIRSMTQRAEAIITILESEYAIEKGGRLSDETMFQALHSVKMEVLDIRTTVNIYRENQRDQGEQNVRK